VGADLSALCRRAAFYVQRILGGAKPPDLPVERPATYKRSGNRMTAAALGLTIAPSLVLRADEVIR
jgi:putative ABC transport system substrate-binding protein